MVDLIDVTQIFEHVQGEADIDPDVADMEASASRVDVVPAMYAEPQVHGSVEVAVDDLTDPRLVDAGVAAAQVAAAAKESQEIQESQEIILMILQKKLLLQRKKLLLPVVRFLTT